MAFDSRLTVIEDRKSYALHVLKVILKINGVIWSSIVVMLEQRINLTVCIQKFFWTGKERGEGVHAFRAEKYFQLQRNVLRITNKNFVRGKLEHRDEERNINFTSVTFAESFMHYLACSEDISGLTLTIERL